jgi:hypothetical protein
MKLFVYDAQIHPKRLNLIHCFGISSAKTRLDIFISFCDFTLICKDLGKKMK